MNNIKRQLDFYEQNKKEIIQQHTGKVIVISEDLNITDYASEEEGYIDAVAKYGYGNFLLKNLHHKKVSEVQIISPIITSNTDL